MTTIPRISEIKRVVGSHYGLMNEELEGDCKLRSHVYPRQIAMFITRRLTKHSYFEIGRSFGGRDHSTVFHAVKQVQSRLVDDRHENLADEIERMVLQIKFIVAVRTPPVSAAVFAARYEEVRAQ